MQNEIDHDEESESGGAGKSGVWSDAGNGSLLSASTRPGKTCYNNHICHHQHQIIFASYNIPLFNFTFDPC